MTYTTETGIQKMITNTVECKDLKVGDKLKRITSYSGAMRGGQNKTFLVVSVTLEPHSHFPEFIMANIVMKDAATGRKAIESHEASKPMDVYA
jgi:hypothetical protein